MGNTEPGYLRELEKLKQLDDSERAAFLDLLVLAILADAKITDEELEQMSSEMLLLPFLCDPALRESVDAHIQGARVFLEDNIHDHDVIDGFIRELSFKLIDPTHRLIALRMFISITMADGTTDLEHRRCVFLADCFGWPASRVDEIQTQING